jgi:hypothetical protein
MITEQKKKFVSRMNELTELIPDTIKATHSLPDNIKGYLYTFLDPGELRISIDYTPQQYLNVRRALAKQWKFLYRNFNSLTGCYYIHLHHRELKVELTLELVFPAEFKEGANCKVVEVGHKTEVIYGLECK